MFFGLIKREKKITKKDFFNLNLSPHELGKLGEKFAVQYLKSLHYKILQRNYKVGNYEIDIIAEHGNYIVFIEVKTRSSVRYGLPSEAVDYVKRQKYKIGANIYLTQNHLLDRFARFDIVEIIGGEPNLIINAFN